MGRKDEPLREPQIAQRETRDGTSHRASAAGLARDQFFEGPAPLRSVVRRRDILCLDAHCTRPGYLAGGWQHRSSFLGFCWSCFGSFDDGNVIRSQKALMTQWERNRKEKK